eukprot:1106244-Pleurochrysis_carterae.AAC.1
MTSLAQGTSFIWASRCDSVPELSGRPSEREINDPLAALCAAVRRRTARACGATATSTRRRRPSSACARGRPSRQRPTPGVRSRSATTKRLSPPARAEGRRAPT